jgi:hypothetical protein
MFVKVLFAQNCSTYTTFVCSILTNSTSTFFELLHSRNFFKWKKLMLTVIYLLLFFSFVETILQLLCNFQTKVTKWYPLYLSCHSTKVYEHCARLLISCSWIGLLAICELCCKGSNALRSDPCDQHHHTISCKVLLSLVYLFQNIPLITCELDQWH